MSSYEHGIFYLFLSIVLEYLLGWLDCIDQCYFILLLDCNYFIWFYSNSIYFHSGEAINCDYSVVPIDGEIRR